MLAQTLFLSLLQLALLFSVADARAIHTVARAAAVTTCSSTKGITPLPVHSHNDYTRNHPLCDALDNGASSIEADVWWSKNTLFVAHTAISQDSKKTLDSLYVQPLLAILNARNPGGVKPGVKPNGLWEDYPDHTLQLLIDFKTDGDSTFQPVVDALKPLTDAGYISSFSNGVFTESAITVVGSGNTPFAKVQSMSPRTVFYDAPLSKLASSPQYSGPEISPLASADFGSTIGWLGLFPISSSSRNKIKQLFADAHARGIKTRFYATPDAITSIMEKVWRELLDDGEDWINADHLTHAKDTYNGWKAKQS